jgi:hypothetical protein
MSKWTVEIFNHDKEPIATYRDVPGKTKTDAILVVKKKLMFRVTQEWIPAKKNV